MINEIGFGIIDNSILVIGAILGFSTEDFINNWLEKIFKKSSYKIQTRIKGLSGSLLGAGIANAISDWFGGWCVSWQLAWGSFIGCLLIILFSFPIIFKIQKKI